jgi:hypothetical protein
MTKRRTRFSSPAIGAAIGYAADGRGSGVAYARVTSAAEQHLLRIPFRVGRTSLPEREVGYAALTAVARALLGRGFGRVRFSAGDSALVDDLDGRRAIPEAMVLTYVRLRCALNQLEGFSLELAEDSDLTQRARAEVALNVAA